MDFHPSLFLFCAVGASVMIVSGLLGIAAARFDNWLSQRTHSRCSRRPNAHRHTEVTHLL
jgi:hypothetical protein